MPHAAARAVLLAAVRAQAVQAERALPVAVRVTVKSLAAGQPAAAVPAVLRQVERNQSPRAAVAKAVRVAAVVARGGGVGAFAGGIGDAGATALPHLAQKRTPGAMVNPHCPQNMLPPVSAMLSMLAGTDVTDQTRASESVSSTNVQLQAAPTLRRSNFFPLSHLQKRLICQAEGTGDSHNIPSIPQLPRKIPNQPSLTSKEGENGVDC
ncbi:MAG: hypothetical protein JSR34_05175 [Proteobacteria bacterium]|nr:hypothetical protein [Pseudomonadota bacterium]